ncbi:MAG: serine/threonine protein kinase, partial [Deltaproteobacteria bacterium]|nr:serine/threonine protein kinase [Deltaproteobacteria bacterium]
MFACEVGAQIADALAAAHAAGIVHRDLKPENIMLEQREDQRIHVRVLDFGIARVLDEQGGGGGERGKLTRAGTVLGTPGYMAPEQALGEPVDGRADLYALGVILWECIAGRDLFVGNDVASIISAQLTQVPDSLRLYAPSIPAELDALVMKLLATKKEDRLASPTHVRDVLHRYVLEHKLERIRETKGGASQTKAWVARVQQAARLATKSITQRLSTIPLKGAIEGIDGWLARFPMLADKRRRVMAMAAGASLAFLLFLLAGMGVSAMLAGGQAVEPIHLPGDVQGRGEEVGGEAIEGDSENLSATETRAALHQVQSGGELSPEWQKSFEMLTSDRSDVRRKEAKRVLKRAKKEDVPSLVYALARFEDARECEEKRLALREVRAIQDPRALPALERLARAPRRGCGFFNLEDCWKCLRRELRATIHELRGGSSGDEGE